MFFLQNELSALQTGVHYILKPSKKYIPRVIFFWKQRTNFLLRRPDGANGAKHKAVQARCLILQYWCNMEQARKRSKAVLCLCFWKLSRWKPVRFKSTYKESLTILSALVDFKGLRSPRKRRKELFFNLRHLKIWKIAEPWKTTTKAATATKQSL